MSLAEPFARRYQLLDRIAIGGTAEVFRAALISEDGSKKPVVIKRVLPQFARDRRFRTLFLEEACVAVSLAHPNIVRVLDHGEIENTCYIALEPVDGKDLGSLLARARANQRPMPIGLAALIAVQVAEALQFIHDQTSSEGLPLRIIHRDVSPQNILVSYLGDVKLTDFGIAKSAIRQESTVDGTLRGKLDYMAPEQATATEVDHRADIFGLGCVLYELVEGTPPFRGATEIDTLDRLRQGILDRPPADLDTPQLVRDALERALSIDPEQRYQSAGELAADLRLFMSTLEQLPSAEDLGQWIASLSEMAKRSDAVDDAVRLLLGDEDPVEQLDQPTPAVRLDDDAPVPSASPTSVFISGPSEDQIMIHEPSTAEITLQRHRARNRWRTWAMVTPLVVLALLGWILWALDRPDPPLPATPGPIAAPRAAPRPATTGVAPAATEVLITSRPPGADVLVAGAVVGSTPHRLSLGDEQLRVVLRRSGYRRWSTVLSREAISSGQAPSTIAATLQRPSAGRRHRRHKPASSGYLTVNSMPWTRVYLDGKFVGNTPLVRMAVKAGNRRVQLRNSAGRVQRSFVAVVHQGNTASYTFDLSNRKP